MSESNYVHVHQPGECLHQNSFFANWKKQEFMICPTCKKILTKLTYTRVANA